jgi:hypothetical protein
MAFSKLYKGVLILGCLVGAQSAQAAHFLYTGGHTLRSQSLAALGYDFTEFTPDDAGWATALSGGDGPFDSIVVGEQQQSYPLSPSTQSSIAAYVSNGGKVVIVSDHAAALTFLNPVFNFSAVESYGCNDAEAINSSLNPVLALHSGFASGAPNLRDLSCTSAIVTSSLPVTAHSLYRAPGNTLAFTTTVGAGQMIWLGWDYCCSNGTASKPFEDAWYFVLASAMAPNYKICSINPNMTPVSRRMCENVCETQTAPTYKALLVANYTSLFHAPPVCAITLPNDIGGG